MFRCLLPLTAALLVPQLAAAGPIGWTYSAETAAGDYGQWVSFGVETQTAVSPSTGEVVNTPYRMMANVARVDSGARTDAGSVRVLTVGPSDLQPYAIDDQWALTRAGMLFLQFDLTDAESGQSRSLSYAATGTSNGYFTSGTGVVSLVPEDRTDTFLLGGNRYTVRAVGRESESAAYLDVDVTVGPAAPEPGTLALAGIGLAAVGSRARRKGNRAGTGVPAVGGA